MHRGYDSFMQATGSGLNARQRQALWLRLALLQKAKAIQWQDGLFVANVGASVAFLNVRQDMFPCVTPHMVYASRAVLLACHALAGAPPRRRTNRPRRPALDGRPLSREQAFHLVACLMAEDVGAAFRAIRP
jgi:hypothetical protein